MKPQVLAIDCGTQSMKAMLFDDEGQRTAFAKVPYEPYFSAGPGWAEQEAAVYHDALCRAVRELKAAAPEAFMEARAVAITTQRDTAVFLDREYKPLRPCILWLDQRENGMHMKDCLNPAENIAFTCAGAAGVCENAVGHGRSHWVKKNEPEVWAKVDKVVMLSCWLNYMLTGELADSYASQYGYIPFNGRACDWYKSPKNARYRIFGVEKKHMPRLVAPGERLGSITRKAADETGIPEGLPVIAAASDKACETLGNGCAGEDTASISFGTTATVETTTQKYVEMYPFMPPVPAALKGFYNPEYEVFRGYWMLSWFMKEFAAHEVEQAKRTGESPETILNAELLKIPAGSGGLMLQPYWTPELALKGARGAIIGFNDSHTRIHIYRAIIEGINFALMEGIERLESKTKTRITRACVAGGGSQSAEICQITANMLGIPVVRVQTHETSGLGAGILAFTGIGHFADAQEAVKRMVHVRDTFLPKLPDTAVYRRLYEEVYKKLYPALKGIYAVSGKILGL